MHLIHYDVTMMFLVPELFDMLYGLLLRLAYLRTFWESDPC